MRLFIERTFLIHTQLKGLREINSFVEPGSPPVRTDEKVLKNIIKADGGSYAATTASSAKRAKSTAEPWRRKPRI
jgi:hypothetical protein